MGRSVNRVTLIGRLGRDPELKYSAGGVPFCRFSIATDETWNDKGGQKQERTEWHNLVAWDKLAEICGKYLTKGAQVYVEGKLQTSEYDDREGIKRKSTQIVLRDMVMLGGKREGGGSGGRDDAAPGWATNPDATGGAITDDDIPF